MKTGPAVHLDVVIFGGGIAGLWLLDHLRTRGYAALLLENGSLGHPQTISCQGIIHGGAKYALSGRMTASATAVSEMPGLWRTALTGTGEPDLSAAKILSEQCYLWGTRSLKSHFLLTGSKIFLRAQPYPADRRALPEFLRTVSGTVLEMDEQVIDPKSTLLALAGGNHSRIWRIGSTDPPVFSKEGSTITAIGITLPAQSGNEPPAVGVLKPRHVVFTAGEGNSALRALAGLNPATMQLRPLHMAMIRGALPRLNGHCVDGTTPYLTVTTTADQHGKPVWLVGGKIAEETLSLPRAEYASLLVREIGKRIPGIRLAGTQFSSYVVNRAEGLVGSGQKPDDFTCLKEGNVITAWPTKLVLAPRLSGFISGLLPPPSPDCASERIPRIAPPSVAIPPWEGNATPWIDVL